MEKKKDKVAFTPQMQTTVKVLLASRQLADSRLQSYLQGCKDALGLEGDWNVDTINYQFTPVPGKEAK